MSEVPSIPEPLPPTRRLPKRLRAARRPELCVEQILRWADEFFERHGRWPKKERDGLVDGTLTERWAGLDAALRAGHRGLPGRSSLAQLLAEKRGVRNIQKLPRFSIGQILQWADSHRARTGDWPKAMDGPIHDAPGETWIAVESALRLGARGLPGRLSIRMLLSEHRGVRNRKRLPAYSIEQILSWADLHHARTGRWPKKNDGPIHDAPGETWAAVDTALIAGIRGLPGQSSLLKVLSEHRGVRHSKRPPPFSIARILNWADAHHARTGRWPTVRSGPIAETPGETWNAVQAALVQGGRGLPGGSSLSRLLAAEGRKVSPSRASHS